MSQQATIRVTTDVGGTFTEPGVLRLNPSTGRQEIITAKADTTPPNFEVVKKLEYRVDLQGKNLQAPGANKLL